MVTIIFSARQCSWSIDSEPSTEYIYVRANLSQNLNNRDEWLDTTSFNGQSGGFQFSGLQYKGFWNQGCKRAAWSAGDVLLGIEITFLIR